MDRLNGVLNASPEKRYKNFISTVVDQEQVWVLSSEAGYATWDEDDIIRLIVYPTLDAAKLFAGSDTPAAIEVHDFLSRCKTYMKNDHFGFMVYPNGSDAFIVSTEQMVDDLEATLALVE